MFRSWKRVTTPKGEYLSANVTKNGRKRGEILAEVAAQRNQRRSTGRRICTGASPSERFVRPVRWLVAMLDGEVVPLEFDGINAGKTSRGHRIIVRTAQLKFRVPAQYVAALRAGKVLDREQREQQIRKALDAATRTIPGRAGAKIRLCWIPSSISPSGRR